MAGRFSLRFSKRKNSDAVKERAASYGVLRRLSYRRGTKDLNEIKERDDNFADGRNNAGKNLLTSYPGTTNDTTTTTTTAAHSTTDTTATTTTAAHSTTDSNHSQFALSTSSTDISSNANTTPIISNPKRVDEKLGHRRVDEDGVVTFKKTPTTELEAGIQLGLNFYISQASNKPAKDLLYQAREPKNQRMVSRRLLMPWTI